MSTFDDLILKLDTFIRKHYKNQLIKGGVYFGFLSISFFTLFALFEFFGEFGVLGRTFLFFGLSMELVFLFISFSSLA